MTRDPYQELGVPKSASADDIRKAFRKLAKQFHPDANPGNAAAEERFKRVSAAFDILGEEAKRKRFDAGLIDADGREAPSWQPHGGPRSARSGHMDTEGLDLGDIFGDIFGRNGARSGNFNGFDVRSRGDDIRAKLQIDLEDAICGAKKRVAFSDGRTLDMSVPKGAFDGQVLRLRGQGEPGRAGAGDALIELSIRPHKLYRVEGQQLVLDLSVSIPDAVLGGKVEAPTPDGPVTLTVPKGTSSGRVLRLKGRGLSDANGQRGDLLVRILLALPQGADPLLEAFAETWRRERPYDPLRR